ncbi:restriction endonuclease subunit S [Nocardia sp. NPDC004568]|uniref:restriction endonuclease subunit S n=1 Tax=Nocardia sp. NPDC004568 TaxID=3154551 RepID=UPI0033A28024
MSWPTTSLGEIALSVRNGIFAKRPTDEASDSSSHILRISAVRAGRVNLDDSRFVEGLTPEQIEKFSIAPGDLLITRYNGSRALVGTAGVVPAHAQYVIHPDKLIRVVLDDRRADPRFVNYQLQSPAVRRHLEPRIRTTAGQSGVAGADVRSIPLVLPGLDEQRRIVEILEDHLSRLDAADRNLRLALARSEALLTAGLWNLTHGLSNAERVELQGIAEVRLGRQRSPKNHSGDRMRPYLRAANVDWDSLRLDDVKEMHFTETEEQTYRLISGDILLTEASGSAAEVGKSALYSGIPADVCFQNTLLRVRCHSADPEFVQKFLLAEARAGRFMPAARGVGINHLGRARLASIQIEIPSPDVQLSIVSSCRELIEAVHVLKGEIESQLKRSQGLRRSLLAAAFSGRLTEDAANPTLLEADLVPA